MAFGALKGRNVAEINWVLKGLVRFMAELAFVFRQRAQIDRMLKGAHLYGSGWVH